MALGDLSPSSSSELHVLAVDDSIVDRKVIERLLRISACKVTTVESGTRALQYLGLDGDKGSSGLKVLSSDQTNSILKNLRAFFFSGGLAPPRNLIVETIRITRFNLCVKEKISFFEIEPLCIIKGLLLVYGLLYDQFLQNFDKQDLKVNLIVTDYSMPGLTGYELLKKIKMHDRRSRGFFAKTGEISRCEAA
ncbi:hypothetical protein Bca4012_057882 [Brassica carinata]